MTLELVIAAPPPPARLTPAGLGEPPALFISACLAAGKKVCDAKDEDLDGSIKQVIERAYYEVDFAGEGGPTSFFEAFFDLITSCYKKIQTETTEIVVSVRPLLFSKLSLLGYELYRFFNRFSFSNDPWICTELGLLLIVDQFNKNKDLDFDIEETRLKMCWLELVSLSIEPGVSPGGHFSPAVVEEELLANFINVVRSTPLGHSSDVDAVGRWASVMIFDLVMEALGPLPTNKQFPVLGYLLASDLVDQLKRLWKGAVIAHGRLLTMIAKRDESDVVRFLASDGKKQLDLSGLAARLSYESKKAPTILNTHRVCISHLNSEVFRRYVFAVSQ